MSINPGFLVFVYTCATLLEALQDLGYEVGLFGNWHTSTESWKPAVGFVRWLSYDIRHTNWVNQYQHSGTVRFSRDGKHDTHAVQFTADHGHLSGQYGLYGKGNRNFPQNLYRESIDMPFIINGPNRLVCGGKIRDEFVNLRRWRPFRSRDLGPTRFQQHGTL